MESGDISLLLDTSMVINESALIRMGDDVSMQLDVDKFRTTSD